MCHLGESSITRHISCCLLSGSLAASNVEPIRRGKVKGWRVAEKCSMFQILTAERLDSRYLSSSKREWNGKWLKEAAKGLSDKARNGMRQCNNLIKTRNRILDKHLEWAFIWVCRLVMFTQNISVSSLNDDFCLKLDVQFLHSRDD